MSNHKNTQNRHLITGTPTPTDIQSQKHLEQDIQSQKHPEQQTSNYKNTQNKTSNHKNTQNNRHLITKTPRTKDVQSHKSKSDSLFMSQVTSTLEEWERKFRKRTKLNKQRR